jgi:hypothetical protein
VTPVGLCMFGLRSAAWWSRSRRPPARRDSRHHHRGSSRRSDVRCRASRPKHCYCRVVLESASSAQDPIQMFLSLTATRAVGREPRVTYGRACIPSDVHVPADRPRPACRNGDVMIVERIHERHRRPRRIIRTLRPLPRDSDDRGDDCMAPRHRQPFEVERHSAKRVPSQTRGGQMAGTAREAR